MPTDATPGRSKDPAAIVLGYLNFSSGAFDPAAWRACSDLYAAVEPATGGIVTEAPEAADALAAALGTRLGELEPAEPAFRDATQARWALGVVFDHVLPGYRRFHADLLEHQPRGAIERPYFVMAALQAVLAAASPGDDPQAAAAAAIDRLNDYVGWRPVAVLENGRLSEPYRHERVRPVPLYASGAGAAHGRYGGLVAGAIDILREAPRELVQQADFELELLEELAIDPRAFDFLHPAASRPNYLFGLWDPARIDGQGNYRRMVVQQATLDGILSWPAAPRDDRTPQREAELRWESSAVLAGVMLMASGLSGHGPGARQAGLPLSELLPRIAAYRDAFYRWLLTRLPEPHRSRLEDEARRLRQPFAGVRRHINAVLAGRRARQVESVALASVLARIGRAAGAERMSAAVPAASARMFSRITSRVVAAHQALRREGETAAALDDLDAATELLFRAVGCGAAVDPWNILGLSGQFPLHEPGGESLSDPRVDDLVNVTGSILDGFAAAWRQAGLAGGQAAVAARAAASLERLAAWWDRFATTTVSGVTHLSGREAVDAAREVIDSLGRRREFADGPPPPGFWRREVAAFTSPRTHAEAADALLREGDLDGSLGLLVHWASLLEGAAVERSGPVWLGAAARWMTLAAADTSAAGRTRVRRFLELVEANTTAVVDLIETVAVGREPGERRGPAGDGEDDEQPGAEESVAAAYESMVWRDSADDGVEGGMIDVDAPGGSAAGGLAAVEEAAEFLGRLGGPLGVELAGTLGDPRAVVTADRPGLGIGLANFVARVTGAPNGYRLAATGDTDYGPLAADVVLLTAAGPLTIDVERGDLSGIGFSGRLVRSAAGPFTGRLDASGQGLGGLVRLSATGEHQAAAINIRANNVMLPGPAQLAVGSAIVDADVTLYDTPHIVADIQVADTQIRDYEIAVARVKIDYRGGSGKAQALVEGVRGVPFRIAANADLRPDLWRASVQGRATGINFRTISPARIVPGPDGYELLPTNIDLGRRSSARVAGRFGEGIMFQSRLDRVNMAILNAVYPDMGLGGRASGSLDFEQANADAFPRADARLTISNFTRTTAASVSQPVDVNFAGKLLADGGEARAVMRKRGTVVGRIQASLRPLGPGAGAWTDRLRAAPLSGGIRYNGPADTLYSFFGPADQHVSGPVAVAADFGCRVADPCLNGIVRGRDMVYENQTYGTRLTGMVINGRFAGNRLEIADLTARAGEGTIAASGYVSLSQADGYPMDLAATLDNARLARSENIAARATGDLRLQKVAGQTALLSGDLRLPETRYRIVREGAAQVPVLTGVRRKASGRARISGDGLAAVGGSLFDLIRLDIRLRASEEIYVRGMGLESEWQADVTLRGTTEAPRVTGEIELVRGTLGFAGRSFELEEGRVTFPTGDAFDPAIRLIASDTIETVTVSVSVTGRASNPQVAFSSVPGLPQDEIVSRILFGDSITTLSPLQAVQLASSLNALSSGGGGLSPLGALQSAAGIDRLRVLGPDDTIGRGAALAAGQYITKDIYLEVITDARGYTATQLEISLTPALSLLSQAGGSGQSNLSIRYRKDY